MAANARPVVDWEAIEIDYRAGIRTLRDMAGEYGVSHVAIKKRADKEGWSRDLSARIKARTEELVNRALVTTPVNAAAERAVVEANAEMRATAIFRHRKDISRHNEIASKHEAALEAAEELPITARIDAHKKLVETRKTLIGLEREALGIDNDRTPGETLDSFLDALTNP